MIFRKLRHIVLCVLMAVGASLHAQINTDQVMRIGVNTLSFEDYVLAIQYFNQVIQAKPYLARPYFYRAYAKLSLDDWLGAEQDATACININPFITDAYSIRAVARHNLKKFDLAVADYDKALQLKPDNHDFIFNRALCLLEMKNYAAADSALHRYQRLDTANYKVYLALAQSSIEQKDTTQAIDYLKRSIKINPHEANPYGNLAQIYADRKDYRQAITCLNRVMDLQPEVANNYINRAYLRYELDSLAEAKSDYDQALRLEPDNKVARYNRALLNAEVGEDLQAISDLNQVLKQEPDNFMALYNRAQLHLRMRQYRSAVRDYDRILRKYPRFESGYMARSQVKHLMGDEAGSQRDMSRAIALFKEKGIKVATYNPIDLEAKKAQRKFKEEAEEAQRKADGKEPETEQDVTAMFNDLNKLVTVEADTKVKPEYDNRSRGHIQNNNVHVDPEPMFHLSYYDQLNKLNGKTYYMREATEANETHLLPRDIVLTGNDIHLTELDTKDRFASIDYYNGLLATAQPRAIDYVGRAMDYMMVRDPQAALGDADRALKMSPDFTLAYFLRADAHFMLYQALVNADQQPDAAAATGEQPDTKAQAMLHSQEAASLLNQTMADLDQVLSRSPKNIYATYNQGYLHALQGNYELAIESYSRAIELKPDLGQAYYNRGLAYLQLGKRQQGEADLSKAGELGILPSYNVLKRMNR